MDNTIIMLVGFVVSLISIITPIIKFNNNLTRLNMAIGSLSEKMDLANDVIKNQELRIRDLEKKCVQGDDL